jgi:hypothetical protein
MCVLALLLSLLWPYIKNRWSGLSFADALVAELSIALFVAGLLGFTFDWWLQRDAMNDVVKVALGYMLPDAIRSEIQWLYGLNVIVTRYHHNFVIGAA